MMSTLIIGDCEAILDPPGSLPATFSSYIWQAICSLRPVPNLAYMQRLHDLPLVSLVNNQPVLSNIIYIGQPMSNPTMSTIFLYSPIS